MKYINADIQSRSCDLRIYLEDKKQCIDSIIQSRKYCTSTVPYNRQNDIDAIIGDRKQCINGVIENLPYRQSINNIDHIILCKTFNIMTVLIAYLKIQESKIEISMTDLNLMEQLYAPNINHDIVLTAIITVAVKQYFCAENEIEINHIILDKYTLFITKILTEIGCTCSDAIIWQTVYLVLSNDINVNSNIDKLFTQLFAKVAHEIKSDISIDFVAFNYAEIEPNQIELRSIVTTILTTYRMLGVLDNLTLGQLDALSLYDCAVVVQH